MDANELLKRIIASGADENGILDRFGDNADLYERCCQDFLESPNHIALQDAIHTRSYEQAFSAAHALKGLSGNLGLTGFYQAVCILTESLRNAQYGSLDEEYTAVKRQYERLRSIVLDEPMPVQEAAPENTHEAALEDSSLDHSKRARSTGIHSLMKDKNNRIFMYLLCATVFIFAVIGFLLGRINNVQKQNVVIESGQHLSEVSNQIKLYIENSIAIDWRIAQSVGDSILGSAYVDDDPAVLAMMQKKRIVWGVSDLMLYTENGYCIYADGSTEQTDVASMTVYHAREQGVLLSIVDSRLIFTVPLETTLTFHGERVVAISVVRDISTFLDEMNFSSFGGSAWLYLTDQNGIVISALSGPSTVQTFNVLTIVEGMEVTPLNQEGSMEDFLFNPKTTVFRLADDTRKLYGVSTAIVTKAEPLMLFYFVPETAVNSVMHNFSNQLMTISMIIIFLFAVVAFTAFVLVYKNRQRIFDRAMRAREKMFDLLVKNTKTAFGLFALGQPQPEYLSTNVADVIGDSYWILSQADAGFCIRNDAGVETENIALVNRELREWNGNSTFRSGYLCNRQGVTPTYFVFELYHVSDDASDFVAIAQDVTALYAREEAAKEAMESAKEANDAKTRFLSSMSHDIRTPMNAIMNMSNFALESIDQPPKLCSYLRMIHESAEHLLHLINDVLDMSRIESGQLVVASAPFSIKEEVQRQADIIHPICKAKNVTLLTDFSDLQETLVSGDALKLSQIVINLLSNAVKFTPEGGAVRFIVKEIPSLREDVVAVCLSVEDNGIGIPQEDIGRIFEPFYRANTKAVGKTDGAGLGLAIVKNYVDVMGGSICCESEFGEGTIFMIELSFPKVDAPISHDNPHAASKNDAFLGMHALVVEDIDTNQMIAKEMLERMGFIVDFAEDGSVAVQKFCNSKPGTYDMIYMDIQMPVMDGLTATVMIRASDHPQAQTIPVIAMTANAFAEDIEKARAAGMDGFVDKPIVSFKLAEQTRIALQNKRGVIK